MNPFGFKNLTASKQLDHDRRCPHCTNNTIVVVDYLNVAAPCPFCEAGSAKNNPPEGAWDRLSMFWNQHRRPADHSWNGGMTLAHDRWCEYEYTTGNRVGKRCNSLSTSRVCAAHQHNQESAERAVPGWARRAISNTSGVAS